MNAHNMIPFYLEKLETTKITNYSSTTTNQLTSKITIQRDMDLSKTESEEYKASVLYKNRLSL